MKICFLGMDNLPVLAPEYNRHGIGGEQVQQTLLAQALVRRGFTVSMVVFDYGQQDGASWRQVVTYKSFGQQAGLPVLRFVHPRWTGLWSAMRRADADIYYLSCAGMELGLAAMFCLRHGRRFVFRVAHDHDCEPSRLLIKYWRDKKLYEYGLRRAHGIFVQTEQQQRALLANYRLPSRIAGMLVERPAYRGARTVDVLWVNNLRQFKRPDLALELARRMPHLSFHMVGGRQGGFDALYDDIARQASQIPNLTFHGRVPYHDMDAHYGRARVFVNTSDSEGFPNSYLQAWVRGTPVVAFFDPDGVIKRRQLGFAAASLEDMQQHIAMLTGDDALWSAASARCRRYMAERHGEERILAPYLSTFVELLT
ncbi:glycosyltransferase family 4 protein [Massilia horti]|uniref:Glycosyltransferase n=1 Tax=Massilia horti TaxID=2562153 RepID=A0A4Y9T487_9BURK|nr:glycosyltransferase family 4 protein [Massilia horti]TFW34382.1 glycosyltransferase [Massilia horti]